MSQQEIIENQEEHVPGTGENFVESESSDEEIEVEENSQSKSQESVVEDVAKAQNLAPGLRGKIYVFMTEPSSSTLASLWSLFMMGFVLASIIVFCVQTLPPFYSDNPGSPWSTIEILISVVFTLDLLLRMATCGDIKSFMKDPFTYIDILSILPFYLGFLLSERFSGVKVVRAVRLTRIFRIFRLGRYASGTTVIFRTLYISRYVLFSLMVVLLYVVIMFSTFVYYAERGEWSYELNLWIRNGDVSPYQSISNSIWFTTITMTTVGYGDLFPISVAGRIITTAAIFVGTIVLTFSYTPDVGYILILINIRYQYRTISYFALQIYGGFKN